MSLMQEVVTVCEWSDIEYDIRYPDPTLEDAKDFGFESIEDFENSNRLWEWRDGFEPMMNYYWPVLEPDDVQAAVNEMHQHAGNTSLIYLEDLDEYAIVLTGGGMDLSWDIVAAYVCCGDVPPAMLLRDLSSHCTVSATMRNRVVLAAHDAADRLNVIAERLKEVQ